MMNSTKAILCGSSTVGKTTLLRSLAGNSIHEQSDQKIEQLIHQDSTLTQPTLGAGFACVTFEYDGEEKQMNIWDTAGQDTYRSLIKIYFRNSQLAILVFDVTNRQTYDDLDGWIADIRENCSDNCPILLIANKIDLEDKREVTFEEIVKYSSDVNLPFIECSAKDNDGTDQIMAVGYRTFLGESFCVPQKEVKKNKKSSSSSSRSTSSSYSSSSSSSSSTSSSSASSSSSSSSSSSDEGNKKDINVISEKSNINNNDNIENRTINDNKNAEYSNDTPSDQTTSINNDDNINNTVNNNNKDKDNNQNDSDDNKNERSSGSDNDEEDEDEDEDGSGEVVLVLGEPIRRKKSGKDMRNFSTNRAPTVVIEGTREEDKPRKKSKSNANKTNGCCLIN